MHGLHETEPHSPHTPQMPDLVTSGCPPCQNNTPAWPALYTNSKMSRSEIRDLSPDIPNVCHWLLVNTWQTSMKQTLDLPPSEPNPSVLLQETHDDTSSTLHWRMLGIWVQTPFVSKLNSARSSCRVWEVNLSRLRNNRKILVKVHIIHQNIAGIMSK